MKLKRVSLTALAGISLSMIALLAIVALSSRRLSAPDCPQPVIRDGTVVTASCVGGLFPGILVIVLAAGLLGGFVTWGVLSRRDQPV
jgi:hypothetical protein